MKYMYRFVNIKQLTLTLGTSLIISLAAATAYADDIEIYLQEPPDPVPPNVLFILDESGSMKKPEATRRNPNPSQPPRRDRLVSAMTQLFNDPNMANVNAAMLGYTTNTDENGPLWLRAINGDFYTIGDFRSLFINRVNGLQTLSYTPTVKAMEAAVNWFRRDRTFIDNATNFATTSPIGGDPENNWCRPNHIVLLTDGLPNSNSPTNGQGYGLTRYEGANCASDTLSQGQDGRCAREIAAFAFNTDLETGTGWTGTQNIVTHTIGFDTDSDANIRNFMMSIANAGGGNYYPASSVASLVSAFTSIITQATESIPYTYSAPVIPFNQDNAAVSGNRIFVPMFVPAAETFWKGNLKSYTIATSSSGDGVAIELSDADGDDIIDDNYAFVSSRDHWNTSGEDGGDPLVGGAAQMLKAPGYRNLYTNVNPSAALSDNTNRVHRTNDLVTYALLGVADGDDTTRDTLLNWISWEPSLSGDASHEGEMGAPLHTQPAVVNYNSGDVILLPTSEGVVEAIDANTGQELWAFMPADLLADIQTLYNNSPASVPYYGLDGPLTVYETNGRKMAIVGMRRGGRNYYLLDVTNKENPSFVTTINADTGLSRLGQTWSKPMFVKMEINGTSARDYLVFGGGYDPDEDNITTSRSNDDEGNAIYIIDAANGSLRASISPDGSADLTISGMLNSITGDLLPVDINSNGITDRLYGVDVGGRIIRVDIPDSEFAVTTMDGGIIADVYTPNQLRKFFNTPEVGYYNVGRSQHLDILIGSGNRTNPLDTAVTDRFYMIKDPAVWAKPTTYETVVDSQLYDASANLVQDGSSTQVTNARNTLASLKGWYIDFNSSEKSYSKAELYDGLVLFTTFSAVSAGEMGVCEARGAAGVGRAYAINIADASAVIDGFGGSEGALDGGDRSKVLSMLGIPPSPTLVFPEGEEAATLGNVVKALVGLEEVAEWPERLRPITWEEIIK